MTERRSEQSKQYYGPQTLNERKTTVAGHTAVTSESHSVARALGLLGVAGAAVGILSTVEDVQASTTGHPGHSVNGDGDTPSPRENRTSTPTAVQIEESLNKVVEEDQPQAETAQPELTATNTAVSRHHVRQSVDDGNQQNELATPTHQALIITPASTTAPSETPLRPTPTPTRMAPLPTNTKAQKFESPTKFPSKTKVPATSTPVSGVKVAQVETSTPQEVAMLPDLSSVDVPGDMLVPVSMIPDTMLSYECPPKGSPVRFISSVYDNVRTVELNRGELGKLVDIKTGKPLPYGVYLPEHKPNIDSRLFSKVVNMNGYETQYGYIYGTVGITYRPGRQGAKELDGNLFLTITFPIDGHPNQLGNVSTLLNIQKEPLISATDARGLLIPQTGQNMPHPLTLGFANSNSKIIYDQSNNKITIPTSKGPVIIGDGAEMMVEFLFNQGISNFAKSWGPQMPKEWTQTLFDNDPTNDPDFIIVQGMSFIVPSIK